MPEPALSPRFAFTVDVYDNGQKRSIVDETYMTNSVDVIAKDLRRLADRLEELDDDGEDDA